MELLSVMGLSKSYGGRKVVDNVSFGVNEAEIMGLLGKNGAGKTTTFRMTIGMIPADAGRVFFESEDISRLVLIWATLEEDRLVWRGVQMDGDLRLRIVEASRTVSADSIDVSAIDRYLDAA